MIIDAIERAVAEEPIRFNPADLNSTALQRWNYTFYETNRTLSNGSACYLAFEQYTPLIFPNGTFANATSCYAPINPIKARGILALVFGSLFALTILFTTINLRKHGKCYLPRERQWTAVGRRWQWYWMLFIAACGTTSCFTGVDVDRDYVVGLPMSLQCFFLALMNPGLNAAMWESVRHWGSWQQRRLLDADAFAFRDGDLRRRIEFYTPVVFYVLDWMVFFLTIPRSWTTVQKQRSPSQALVIAAPAATDIRFKAGAIISAIAFLVICFSLAHSKIHYRAPLARTVLVGAMLALAIHNGYWVASAWRWDMNPFNLETDLGWQYGLNYNTALSVLTHLNFRGYFQDNEDKILIAERAARGHTVDRQLGLDGGKAKPSWWFRSVLDRGKTRGLSASRDPDLEMRVFNSSVGQARSIDEDESGSWWWQRRNQKAKDSNIDLVAEAEAEAETRVKGSSMLQPEGPPLRRRTSQTRSEQSGTSNYSTFEAKPQTVRSMLDI